MLRVLTNAARPPRSVGACSRFTCIVLSRYVGPGRHELLSRARMCDLRSVRCIGGRRSGGLFIPYSVFVVKWLL